MSKYYFSVSHNGDAWSNLICRPSVVDGFRYLLKHSLVTQGDTIRVDYVDELFEYSFHRFFIFIDSYFLVYHDSRKGHHIYRVGDNNEVLVE